MQAGIYFKILNNFMYANVQPHFINIVIVFIKYLKNNKAISQLFIFMKQRIIRVEVCMSLNLLGYALKKSL